MIQSCDFKLVHCVLVLSVSVGFVACGGSGGTSYSSLSETMAGSWDFTVTNSKGRVPFVIEAILDQDHHGNISATGSVAANGPAGNVSTVIILGPSLSSPYPVYLDYPGFTCDGTDTGDRSVTGTINSSSQVTLNWNVGGRRSHDHHRDHESRREPAV